MPTACINGKKGGKGFFIPFLPFIRVQNILCLCFTVHTSVNFPVLVRQHEYLLELLLAGCDAAGIFASEHTVKSFGKVNASLFHENAVSDNINCNTRVNIAEGFKVDIYVAVDFDNILLAHFFA